MKAYTLFNLDGAEAVKHSRTVEYHAVVYNANNEIVQQTESKDDVAVFMKKFDDLCNPQSNTSMERHFFHS